MALEIDKKSTALVVIDLQMGIALMERQLAPYSAETVIGNAARLADAFRKEGMPVFLVHVMVSQGDRIDVIADDAGWGSNTKLPDDWADFVPELGPKDGDIMTPSTA